MKSIATVGRGWAIGAALAGFVFAGGAAGQTVGDGPVAGAARAAARATTEAAEARSAAQREAQEDKAKRKARKAEKKKAAKAARANEKRKRQRGKTVRAVMAPTTPAAPVAAATPERTAETAPAPTAEPEPAVAETAAAVASDTAPAAAMTEPATTEPATTEPATTEPATAVAPATEPAAAMTEPAMTEPAAAPAAVVEPAPISEPAAAAPAAEAPRDLALGERIRVAEVLLDVLVTDKKGNVIDDLDADDFVVLHEGQEQEVTSASFYGSPNELAATGQGGTTRADRYFILMFHDQRLQAPFLAAPQLDNGRWLRRWVEEELQPNDQVAVFAYQARLKFYLDFTRDREEILEAVEAAARGRKDLDRWTTRSAPQFDPNSPSLGANLPTGKELGRRSRKLQQALELLGHAAEGIAGRKNLVMFSLGFGEIGQFGSYTPDPRYYPQMREALNAGNVAVYTVDTMGSRRRSIASASLNDSLSLISNETGGHYYANFTNVMTPMRQVAEENQGYYLVSFRSEYEAGTEGYRNIKVKVREGDYKVRSRTGFRYGESSGL